MYVEIKVILDVGKQDTTKDAIKFAQNHIRTINNICGIDELIDMMLFETNIHPECILSYLSAKSNQR